MKNQIKNQMKSLAFETLLISLLQEYRTRESFFEVPVRQRQRKPGLNKPEIGIAAGPHTQLAQNIVSAYGAGASLFELKTVQQLSGEDLAIKKPCILISSEVYNREWSSEFPMEEAAAEYIKAYLLIKVLDAEFSISKGEKLRFILSVGYDTKGITSERMSNFFSAMRQAKNTLEWKKDIEFLYLHKEWFEHIDATFFQTLSDEIATSVTLSTMHGCPREEIEQMTTYLMCEQNFDVYVKFNPTLLGREQTYEMLRALGYHHIQLDEESFRDELDFDGACQMVERLMETAQGAKRKFALKLTNTLGTKVGTEMRYMSGRSLYPLSLSVSAKLKEVFPKGLEISYSGGVDEENFLPLILSGIENVTLCSYLLQPKGYQNISKILDAIELSDETSENRAVTAGSLVKLAKEAFELDKYKYQARKEYLRREEYSAFCALCHHCVDLCPNRANRSVQVRGKKVVIHLASLCNECGLCSHYCIMGHDPYLEKYALEDANQFLLGEYGKLEADFDGV